MLGAYFRDVNVARAIDCDSIRRFKFFYARNESALWREFLDTPVICIGDKDISHSVHCKGAWVVKLTFSTSLPTFKCGHRRLCQINPCQHDDLDRALRNGQSQQNAGNCL